MNETKLLIDTNILIALEDPGTIDPVAAEFSRRCQEEGIAIHVHPSTLADFNRDKNSRRQQESISRHAKFPVLDSIPRPQQSELESTYGPIRSGNDQVDVDLLHALAVKAVDILVSQDTNLHRRVRGSEIEDRVLTLSDVVAWLRSLQDSKGDSLPHVDEVKAYALDLNDEIFDSLSQSYPGFASWWETKCVRPHRLCWVVRGKDGRLDGLVVRKKETGDEVGLSPNRQVLKLCTFKVAEHAQGTKIGELLLKKAIWHAQHNNYDAIYLTTFPAQSMLIDLMTRYGFEVSDELENGELVLTKIIHRNRLDAPLARSADQVRRDYPRFSLADPYNLYVVPIRWRYFSQLFPEAAQIPTLPLFPEAGSLATTQPTSAGNTIRKVYITKSKIQSLNSGDTLFFYLSKDKYATNSQCITTVGIVESARRAYDFRGLSRLVAGRSVYSHHDLEVMIESGEGLTVIDFLLVGHLTRPLPITELVRAKALSAPPQSISRLSHSARALLTPAMNFGFAI
jgi:hypothetical protein